MQIHRILRSSLLAPACLVLFVLALGCSSTASAQTRRVPAEWEPQQALWLQWPGPFEQTFVTAYAEISNAVVQYQPLHILHHNNSIKNQARNAIALAGGDPDHPNITYHLIANDSAWMRDNGPIYVVEDGEICASATLFEV